jgi:hypothetical protein
VGFNIARAVGPALGGLIMGFSNAGVVFVLNAASFPGRDRRYCGAGPTMPAAQTGRDESIVPAMRAGLRYVRGAPSYHAVLIRAGLFSLGGQRIVGALAR